MKSIPNALVESKTPLIGTMANTTNEEGIIAISLFLENKKQQVSYVETLISQGYSIEATTCEYVGHGIGTIS
jgi:hypothetical protein